MATPRKFLVGQCCTWLSPRDLDTYLTVTDSNRVLLSPEYYAISLDFDNDAKGIAQLFSPSSDTLSYLNTTFVTAHGLTGIFSISGGAIRYSNPEGFTTAEIMAIFIPKTKVFVIGAVDAPNLPNVAYISIPNGDPITHATLNGDINEVRLFNIPLEPKNTNGYTVTGSPQRTITPNGPDLVIENCVLYVDLTETT